MVDRKAKTSTVDRVERETDDIFRRLTADLEAEFAAIEQDAHRPQRRRRRAGRNAVAAGATGALGTAATMTLGLVEPYLGAACMLATVLLMARLLR
jgi:hypothetical protein